MAMAVILAASVMLFFVFNSGRAVNQKINLVNAADAAAYSGGQIAARQLNFMAYTNRAMIANEVSVGHMFSYQMEMNVVQDMFQNLLESGGGLVGQLLVLIINIFVPGFSEVVDGTLETFGQALDFMGEFTQGVSGAYSLVIDANNAFYADLQQEAFRDFAYPEEGQRPMVEAAMAAVLENYSVQGSAGISLNDQAVLDNFVTNGTPEVAALAQDASDLRTTLCKMMLFVRPSGSTGGNVGAGNQMEAFCNALALGGGDSGGAGAPGNPMADNGAMLSMLRETYSNMENAAWIRNRDINYRGLLLTRMQRRGSTTLEYDEAAGQLNWQATDSIRMGDPLFNIRLASGSASGNAGDISEQSGSSITGGLISLFETWGLCGDGASVDCDTLAGGRYKGVQNYAYLNPSYVNNNPASRPKITAFVSQSSCGDSVGTHGADGVDVEWQNNLRSFEDEAFCRDTVYAVAQAEVFFQRPACSDDGSGNCAYGFRALTDDDGNEVNELPNLFNPFWQVRIIR